MATTNLGSVSLFFSSRKQTNYLVPRLMTSSWSRIAHRSSSSRCYHDKSLKAVTPSMIPVTKTGNGIVDFLQGKSYFITGATGFLAKVFIEKLLRETPEIGKIFLLIKAKDLEEAKKRLYNEIISSDLFKLLKQKHGKSYDAFLKNKLIPIVGDIAEDNLGMDSEISSKISEEIDVIISSAARTTFDDRYDSALSINALGPGRLLIFAKKCKKLNLFLHFSTAYVTGKRQGTILETPLCIGQNITSDLNIETELRLAEEALRNFHGNGEVQKMKELGIERAQIHGWENTYTFTKAMGETAIHSNRGDLPVVIIRPSIIESSYSEPFPGWIQGFRMADPVILAYGKGQLPGFWGDPQALVDIVPVDMVVNAAIAAMTKHGDCVTELKVYNVTSSLVNPLGFRELMDLALQHLRDYPLTETTIKPIEFHRSMEDFTSCISKTIAKQERENNLEGGESDSTLSIKGKKKLKYFVAMAKIYEPYAFFQARFDDSNTRRLLKEMSMEDRKMFEFDVRGIDWKHYFVNVHLPGLKRHLINGRSGLSDFQ